MYKMQKMKNVKITLKAMHVSSCSHLFHSDISLCCC